MHKNFLLCMLNGAHSGIWTFHFFSFPRREKEFFNVVSKIL